MFKKKFELEKFLSFIDELEKWREIRHLDYSIQRCSLYANLLEELTELERAFLAEDEEGIVDAYCDLMVFIINSFDLKNFVKQFNDAMPTIESKNRTSLEYKSKVELRHMNFDLHVSISNFCRSIYNGLSIDGSNESNFKCYEACKLIIKIFEILYYYGYNPFLCLNETIKCISSRSGYYDEKIKKFIKDQSPEAIAKWYEPKYKKCKI